MIDYSDFDTTGMKHGDVATILEARQWTFAKTMPHIPHFWSARRDWPDNALYTAVVQFIYDHGRQERFKHFKPKPYLYLNGWRYWCMGAPAHETTIINRCDPQNPKLAPHIKPVE